MGFITNRSSWIDIALGTWLLAAPLVLGFPIGRPLVVAENVVPGILLIAASAWILAGSAKVLSLTYLQMIGSLWLIVGSFVLMFRHAPTAALDGFVIGMVVLGVYISAMVTYRPS